MHRPSGRHPNNAASKQRPPGTPTTRLKKQTGNTLPNGGTTAGKPDSPSRALLALELEPLIAAQAKQRQVTSTGGANPQLLSKRTEADPVDTREVIADTLGLLNGATLEQTQQLLRHAKLDTTMIYSHHLDRAKNDIEERIARAIF